MSSSAVSVTKKQRRRKERRALGHELLHWATSRFPEDHWHWFDDYVDYDDHSVRWRMATEPFRLVPTWVKSGAEEEYELNRAFWALAGYQICPTYGLPAELCTALAALHTGMACFACAEYRLIDSADYLYAGTLEEPPRYGSCSHVSVSGSI